MAGVKFLSDSNIFKNAIANIQAGFPAAVTQAIPVSFSEYIDTLPNEANGDPVPSSGVYVSGQGIIKVA